MKRQTLLRLGVPAAAALLAPAAVAAPALAAAPVAPTVTQVSASAVVGQTVKFKFAEPDGSRPAEYRWMINGGELLGEVTATDGRATAKIVATRTTTQLAVYAIGADGSFGDTANVTFNATQPAAYADQDLDGDARPDLVAVVGDTLLVAGGKGTGGKVRVPAASLGSDSGAGGTFAGMQIITGKFTGGPFEDYLAYEPGTGVALAYDGLGAVDLTYPRLVYLNEHSIGPLLSDWDGNNPIQLATAYDGSGPHTMPDLVGILGSATSGYHFEYYVSYDAITGFYQTPVDTAVSTPAGGSDWENWKISSKLLPSGTAVSLWNPTTGALYLWEGVTFDNDSGRLSYTPYRLSAKFFPGAGATLRLTDFDADGVPDIWAVSPAGSVTAYQVSGLSPTGTARLKAKAPQPLV